METKGAGVLVVTALDEVAWLLNLRGSDIEYNPVFFAYVIVTQTEVRYSLSGAHNEDGSGKMAVALNAHA